MISGSHTIAILAQIYGVDYTMLLRYAWWLRDPHYTWGPEAAEHVRVSLGPGLFGRVTLELSGQLTRLAS